ncbi:(2Fe-2S)-binding protein [Aneurinibacillus sp. REN35]|uniref:(2Fe-2S)-binding protein n=1 Tax=Aneurinibacillus sp. REN35 TaxID=3237286 RepID=UPI00352910C2
MRVWHHPVLGSLTEQKEVEILFDGSTYHAFAGESIAAALLANGVRTLRYTESKGEPRGIYCGIGHCYECRVEVNGIRSIRACITPVTDGMVISSQGGERDGC